MSASIQVKSDFVYKDAGKPGELVFEIKGAGKTPFLPEIVPVAPGIYLSKMTAPASRYPPINFKVNNAPVTFCLTLSGRFFNTFSSPGGFKDQNHDIGPNTNTIGSFKRVWGNTEIDPCLPITCVELHIDPRLLYHYLPGQLMDSGLRGKKNQFFQTRELLSFPLDPQLRKTALEIVSPPQLEGPALELFYQSRGMVLLSRQIELFCQNDGRADGPPPPNSGIRDQLAQAKSILTSNFMDPPTIPILARRCGLNEFTLKKEFKKAFNTTIFNFVQKLKMEQAWTLIREENHSVSQAANAVGYINVSHFSKAFKKQFNMNPGILKKAGNSNCPAPQILQNRAGLSLQCHDALRALP